MKDGLNVLSLFNGMSFLRMALDDLDVKVNKYYSAEIDKFANKATEALYPDTIQVGSVTEWREWNINWSKIDLVVGGFPCQAWSMAGKQLGDKDERGMLFWVMLDIMKQVLHFNPNAKLLIENVKMKKEFEQYITTHTENALGEVHKILINSALVSAQNRNRYYWTNFEVTQPEDQGILLKDIIEHDGDFTFMSEKFTTRNKNILRDNLDGKSKTLSAMEYVENGRQGDYIRTCEPREFNKESLCHHAATATDIKGNDSVKRVYADSGKSPTLTTMGGGHREPKVLLREKSKTVRASGRGSYDRHEWDYISDCHYRKLTPRECFRLQTVPEDKIDILLSAGISNTQLYKMCGNGFTMKAISHILRHIK